MTRSVTLYKGVQPPAVIIERNLRKEGFDKGYRGKDLELYAKGLPVPERDIR